MSRERDRSAPEPEAAGFSKAAFAGAFATLQPEILSEWDEVDEAALAATGGELDKVVALIAERSGHTKALVRRQLQEIYHLASEPAEVRSRPRRGTRERAAHEREPGAPHIDHLIEELERRTAQIVRELRGGFLDGARASVREHTLFSLLVACGLGFIVGVLFTGFSRGRGN